MTFKKHLLERVVNNLADLNSFIERADEGLMQQVKEGDYQNLINVMGILQVRFQFFKFIYGISKSNIHLKFLTFVIRISTKL